MTPPPTAAVTCTVAGAELLPAESGGAEALCAEIERAAASVSGQHIAVQVRIVSPFLATAMVTGADGRRLPEQKVGISDRPLNRQAFAMLAAAIAAQLARDERG